jgi:hypothetical protein
MSGNSSHVLVAVGERLYHARPPNRLEPVALSLPPVDAGIAARRVTAAVSECGAVAVNTGARSMIVRGVSGW